MNFIQTFEEFINESTQPIIKKGSSITLYKDEYTDIQVGKSYKVKRLFQDGDIDMVELEGYSGEYELASFEDLDHPIGKVIYESLDENINTGLEYAKGYSSTDYHNEAKLTLAICDKNINFIIKLKSTMEKNNIDDLIENIGLINRNGNDLFMIKLKDSTTMEVEKFIKKEAPRLSELLTGHNTAYDDLFEIFDLIYVIQK